MCNTPVFTLKAIPASQFNSCSHLSSVHASSYQQHKHLSCIKEQFEMLPSVHDVITREFASKHRNTVATVAYNVTLTLTLLLTFYPH